MGGNGGSGVALSIKFVTLFPVNLKSPLIIFQLLSNPERLLDLAGPTISDDEKPSTSSKKKLYSDLDLLKL